MNRPSRRNSVCRENKSSNIQILLFVTLAFEGKDFDAHKNVLPKGLKNHQLQSRYYHKHSIVIWKYSCRRNCGLGQKWGF